MAGTSVLDHRTALIYVMVLMSAVDNEMMDVELRAMGETVRTLPIFEGYDLGQISEDAKTCASLLSEDDGLDAALGLDRRRPAGEAPRNRLCAGVRYRSCR